MLLEQRMATTSEVARLVVEEMMLNEAFTKPQEAVNAVKVLSAVAEKIPEVKAFLEKIKTAQFDKSLYRKAAMKVHPDKNPDNPEMEEVFKNLSGFSGIADDLLKKALQQPPAQQASAAPQEVLKDVKAVKFATRLAFVTKIYKNMILQKSTSGWLSRISQITLIRI